MTLSLAPARAAAARRNGALSRGPKTAAGKARSAQNALKHGLCAQRFVVLHDEDAQAYAALEAAVLEELAPVGVVQRLLAVRVVRAAWRLERAERIETELFAHHGQDGDLALALIRDGNGARCFDTLLRYRGSALAEFHRALRTLQALQAEAQGMQPAVAAEQPNEPEARTNPGKIGDAAAATVPQDHDRADKREKAGIPAGDQRRALRRGALEAGLSRSNSSASSLSMAPPSCSGSEIVTARR